MDGIIQMPEWLGVAVVGAIIAAIGYVAKLIIQWITEVLVNIRDRRARLIELLSLLQAGKDIFHIQCDNRDRLDRLISERDPKLYQSLSPKGYERLFTVAYPDMQPEEKELHSIIRSYTMTAIHGINEQTLQWLHEDTFFKAQTRGKGKEVILAKKLAQLDAHLRLWIAKYNAWMPAIPEHSLVYLADEEHHGVEFPSNIEKDIQDLLKTKLEET